MIFSKIEKVRSSFTKSEKKLVEYIENNSHKVVNYNVMELSEVSGISAPSIVRFAKKLGYDGFIDMRIALGKISNKGDTLDKKYNSTIEFYKSSLTNTLNFIDEKKLEHILEILKSSKKIAVLGIDGSEEIARGLYIKLLKLNMNSISDSSLDVILELTKNFTEKDSLVILSHCGENLKAIELLKELLMKEVTIIAITKAEKNSIGLLADINILTDNADRVFKLNQMAIIDTIIDYI